jgi:hypothetical protein
MTFHCFAVSRRGALALVLGMTLLAVGLAGCGGAAGQPDALAVATVNGHAISMSDYQTVLTLYQAIYSGQGQELDWQNPSGRANLLPYQQQALDFLVNLELMREQLKTPISAKAIAAQRANLMAIRAQYAQQGAAGAAVLRALTPRLIELYAEQGTTQSALMAQVLVPTYNARGILVKSLTTAQSLERQAVSGADFGQLAHDNSLDSTSAAQNGQLGTVYPGQGQYPAPFDADAFGSGPSQTHNGAKYIIITFSSAQYVLFELTQFKNVPLKSISDAQTQQNAFTWWLTNIVRAHASIQQNILLG